MKTCARHPDRPVRAKGLCASCYMMAWRKAKPEEWKAQHRRWRGKHPDTLRDYDYKRKYGITLADYEAADEGQDGCCAICSKTFDRLHVDHDPLTGQVRGLLRGPCNRGLGMFQHNPDHLNRAAGYLVGVKVRP